MSSSAITGPILSDVRRAPAGTAAAPSFAFNDSTGTGVYLVSAGVLGLSTNGVQRVVVDASGTVGIGVVPTTGWFSTYRTLQLGTYASLFTNNDHVTLANNLFVDLAGTDKYANSDFGSMYRQVNGQHQFWSAASGTAGNNMTLSQNMTLDASGNLLVGTTSSPGYHSLAKTHNDWAASVQNSHASSPFGLLVRFTGSSPNNGSNHFFLCLDTTTTRMNVYSNGGIANYQGNNINLSDKREKKEFAPAKSYLDVISQIPVQTFKYIDQTDEERTLGVVAQDVQAVAPELVSEDNWGTEEEPKPRLAIYQTDLQYALMKCIQELKEKNDALEARLAALESK